MRVYEGEALDRRKEDRWVKRESQAIEKEAEATSKRGKISKRRMRNKSNNEERGIKQPGEKVINRKQGRFVNKQNRRRNVEKG